MADNYDQLALKWVREEVNKTLDQARQALEAYAENADDSTQIGFCVSCLHQVRGTLQMLEFYGAALFAEEMEALADAIANGKVKLPPRAMEILMGAILQLPTYLERVQAGQRDLPVVLLPLLNDLRASRGETLLSESAIFTPNLVGVKAPQRALPADAPRSDDEWKDAAKKLRNHYQRGLLGVLRQQELAESLLRVQKVLERMEMWASGTHQAQLWWVACGFAEVIAEGEVYRNASVHALLGQLDKFLKHIGDAGREVLDEDAPTELLKNLLYYIACSTRESPRVRELQQAYYLKDALPSADEIEAERRRMVGTDAQAMRTVLAALQEDLAGVKDGLDLYVRSKTRQPQDLLNLMPTLRQIADTLGLLGLGVPRDAIRQQVHALQRLADSGEAPSDAHVMDIAGALLFVEANLSSIAQNAAALAAEEIDAQQSAEPQSEEAIAANAQYDDARTTLLAECRSNLQKCKDSIIDFMANSWDHRLLDGVPNQLTEVQGGLQIIGLPEAAELVGLCQRYLSQRVVSAQGVPDAAALDALADVLTSVEYFLESLQDAGGQGLESVLTAANDAAAVLAHDLASAPLAQTPAAEAPAEPVAAPVASAPAIPLPVVDGHTDDDLIDQEVIDIFIEEAGEQLATINDLMPGWLDNPEDREALITIRRAFHTLKGSGRLVGAKRLGEMAWAVESMLNRVLDASVPLMREHQLLVKEAAETVVPALREAFARGTEPAIAPEPLMARAEALGRGEIPDSFAPSTRAVEPAPSAPAAVELAATVASADTGAATTAGESFAAEAAAGLAGEEAPPAEFAVAEIPLAETGTFERPIAETPATETAAIDTGASETAGADMAPGMGWTSETVAANADLTAPDAFELSPEPALEFAPLAEAAAEMTFQPDTGAELVTLAPVTEPLAADAATGDWQFVAEDALADALPDREAGLSATLPTLDEAVAETPLLTPETALGGDTEFAAEPFADAELAAAGAEALAELPLVDEAETLADWLPESEASSEAAPPESPVRAAGFAASDSEDSDFAVREIFAGEAGSHLDAIERYLTDVALSPFSPKVSDELIRALHTLKGSARMAAIAPIADLMLPLEKHVRELQNRDAQVDAATLALLADTLRDMRTAVQALEAGGTPDADALAALQQRAETLHDALPAVETRSEQRDPEVVALFLNEAMDLLSEADLGLRAWQADPADTLPPASLADTLSTLAEAADTARVGPIADLSRALTALYLRAEGQPDTRLFLLGQRGQDHLLDLLDRIAADQNVTTPTSVLAELLAWQPGVSEAVTPAADLAEPAATEAPVLEYAAPELSEPSFTAPSFTEPAFAEQEFAEPAFALPEGEAIELAPVDEPATDYAEPELAEPSFAEPEFTLPEGEAIELVPVETPAMEYAEPELSEPSFALPEAEAIELTPVEAPAMEYAEPELSEPSFTDAGLAEPEFAQPQDEAIELPAAEAPVLDYAEPELSGPEFSGADLAEPSLAEAELAQEVGEAVEAAAAEAPFVATADSSWARPAVEFPVAAAPEPAPLTETEVMLPGQALPIYEAGDVAKPVALDADAEEILEVFLEEANDILDSLDETLGNWAQNPEDRSVIALLQRQLHTLKGGARLSDLNSIGDLSHELENLFEAINDGRLAVSPVFQRVAQEGRDRIADLVKEVQDKRTQTRPGAYWRRLKLALAGQDPYLQSAETSGELPLAETPAGEPAPVAAAPAPAPKVSGEKLVPFQRSDIAAAVSAAGEAQRSATAEYVRVGAGMLENLVNLVGETSIFRSRLEQQMVVLRHNLIEMEQTVARLRDQLRGLEIENEAQIAHRLETLAQDYEEFDPLEMDRYTRQQELTRSLSESTGDLLNLKEALDNLTADSETLLLQQGRVNSELQDGLMRTRMVPFSSVVPRLKRMVRQIGEELGKAVEIAIVADGEMDRTVLERMVAPLEHMLRNAIDHGIERPEKRKTAGKPATGRIKIRLMREGNEVVIEVADDGAGINVDAVKRKAIERGLITGQSQLTDHELMLLILEAGFSTAEQVTQISGRGVGMDVVASEIKALGGRIDIASEQGQGTRFTVRLPFTVSVNQALMVQVGDDVYAIPLTNIEGIVRVSPYELQSYYQDESIKYDYAGQQYRMRYLGKLLDHQREARLEGVFKPVPVLLLHGAEQPVALQVDELLGSREIVVKSVGSLLSVISGLSGATILGDGRVVLILDLPALLRRADAVLAIEAEQAAQIAEQPLVMVVDDSITVRKVTARLLERQNYRVITAKDGVDAVNLLHDQVPDIMLLDIEMPRMDGFELAGIMRHDERLKAVPIIMITSRTGDKHRTRAEEIGVNRYLGKPFNDVELLQTMEQLLAERHAGVSA